MSNRAGIDSAYIDICNGYSEVKSEGQLFIKHLNSIDLAKIGRYYENNISSYAIKGAKKQDQILKEKIKTKEWSEDYESQIKSLERNILLMHEKKSKASIESQIDEIDEIIKDYHKDLSPLLEQKFSFFLNSAEHLADLATTDFVLSISLFLDQELKTLKFQLEDIEYFSNEETKIYVKLYQNNNVNLSRDIIRKVAIDPKFIYFFEGSVSPESFFGKCGKDLTQNQILLFDTAKRFSKLISEIDDLSEEERSDPDLIEKAYILFKNSENAPQSHGVREAFVKAKNFNPNN